MVVVVVVLAALAGYLLYTASTGSKPVHYIPDVVYGKLNQTTDYNYWNLIKDGIIVGVLGSALGTCSVETFGTCAASFPAIGSVVNGALHDTIVTVTADFEFANDGNGTATNLTFGVAVYSDSKLVSTNYYTGGNLAAGTAIVVPYHYTITLEQIPAAIWNYIQGKGQIDIELANVTYGGRT